MRWWRGMSFEHAFSNRTNEKYLGWVSRRLVIAVRVRKAPKNG